MNARNYFCQQRQQKRIHIEQLNVLIEQLKKEGKPVDRVRRQLEREQHQLAILEDIWTV